MLLTLFLLLWTQASCLEYPSNYIIDPDVGFQFFWLANSTDQTLSVKLTVRSSGWIGFGNSPNGGMIGADVFTAWVQSTGQAYINDRLAVEHALPPLDSANGGSEDWTLISATEVNSYTTIEARRKLVTNDLQDHPFTSGVTKLVFAYCDTDPDDVNGTLLYHTNRYLASLNLWDGTATNNTIDTSSFPPDTETSILRFPNFTVPKQETNYYCVGFTLDSGGNKAQAIAFDPIIVQSGLVHHMLLYTCTTPSSSTPFECSSMKSGCSDVMWAWAVGGAPFIVPNTTGFPFGEDTLQYVLLQIHYDNSKGIKGAVDSSGVTIYHTQTLRPQDAAFVKFGHPMNSLSIPPGEPAYELGGVCDSDATQHMPLASVSIFASLLHMHTRGRKIWTDQYRGGNHIGTLGSNVFYDFNYQAIQMIDPPVPLKRSDKLVTHCVYDTTQETTTIIGGESTTQEMCFNFLAYYPKIEGRNSCFSSSFPDGSSTTKWKMRPAVIAAIVLVCLAIVGTIVYCVLRKKRRLVEDVYLPQSDEFIN